MKILYTHYLHLWPYDLPYRRLCKSLMALRWLRYHRFKLKKR